MAKKKPARRPQQRTKGRAGKTWTRLGGGLLALAIIALIVYFVWQGAKEDSFMDSDRPLADVAREERNAYFSAYPETVIDPEKTYEAVIRTDAGDMRFRLFAKEAPQTVNSFVYLANQGYFDNTTFHRVIENFMAQAGDPTGTGRGGPGYVFADEFQSGYRFDRAGLLAMANAGPRTNGSQFFITFVPTPHLNNRHTIFGEVVDGEEVLSQIVRREPGSPRAGTVIERIDIVEE